MWEAIGNFFKTFAEKHLIPSVISLAAGFIAVLALPEDSWMITKISKVGVGVLAFALCFLLVELIIFIAKRISKKISDRKYEKKHQKQLEKETIDNLWSSVDSFTPGDRALIHNFLETNNEPIETEGYSWYEPGSLFSSGWVDSTLVPYHFENEDNEISKEHGIPLSHFINQGKTRYKLKDDIFQLLKYSMEKYGKISSFE